jgi:hypothetical protein
MSADDFLNRVFRNLPRPGSRFEYKTWRHSGRPTSEGVGLLPAAGVDVEKMAAAVLDLDHYKGNIDFVEEARIVPDSRYSPPATTRFYQRVKIPVLGSLHHELLMEDKGERDGWRVLSWYHLGPENDALSSKVGARTEYNIGAWMVKPDAVAYALSSCPRKSDVGRLKFAALTKGADAGAAKVLQANIEGMLKWSRRR